MKPGKNQALLTKKVVVDKRHHTLYIEKSVVLVGWGWGGGGYSRSRQEATAPRANKVLTAASDERCSNKSRNLPFSLAPIHREVLKGPETGSQRFASLTSAYDQTRVNPFRFEFQTIHADIRANVGTLELY